MGPGRGMEAATAPQTGVTVKAPHGQMPPLVPGMAATVAAAEPWFHCHSNSERAR